MNTSWLTRSRQARLNRRSHAGADSGLLHTRSDDDYDARARRRSKHSAVRVPRTPCELPVLESNNLLRYEGRIATHTGQPIFGRPIQDDRRHAMGDVLHGVDRPIDACVGALSYDHAPVRPMILHKIGTLCFFLRSDAEAADVSLFKTIPARPDRAASLGALKGTRLRFGNVPAQRFRALNRTSYANRVIPFRGIAYVHLIRRASRGRTAWCDPVEGR